MWFNPYCFLPQKAEVPNHFLLSLVVLRSETPRFKNSNNIFQVSRSRNEKKRIKNNFDKILSKGLDPTTPGSKISIKIDFPQKVSLVKKNSFRL